MKLWIKIIFVLIVLGFIAAMLVYFFIYNKPHPDIEKMEPAYSLNAEVFYNSFISDRKVSEEKYNGKVIEITGILSKIETTDSTVIVVFVFNQGMFGDEGIRCSVLAKFHSEARLLQPESIVTIKGYCSGYNDTDVILEQSSIVK